jgi:hypothetical protein
MPRRRLDAAASQLGSELLEPDRSAAAATAATATGVGEQGPLVALLGAAEVEQLVCEFLEQLCYLLCRLVIQTSL